MTDLAYANRPVVTLGKLDFSPLAKVLYRILEP